MKPHYGVNEIQIKNLIALVNSALAWFFNALEEQRKYLLLPAVLFPDNRFGCRFSNTYGLYKP